jgi:arabinoxylan arabinofuranohydrolase
VKIFPPVNEPMKRANQVTQKLADNIFIITSLGAILLTGIARADNPIIPHQGVCDPRIHIFNNRAWLFSTHDDARGHPAFTMYDWQLFSSPDLIHWRKEFVPC